MSKKMVTPIHGKPFEVDISDEACTKFGVKHRDRVICKANATYWQKATVMGVARKNAPYSGTGDEILWLAFDHNDGKVSFYLKWGKENFSRISE